MIYELQIHSDELYAFEPLLSDEVSRIDVKIAKLRKCLGIPSEYPNQQEMLIEIQTLQGRQAILQDVLSQLAEQGL